MEDTRARWERAFLEAVDFDTWGQVEEAIEGYQRLQVAAAAEYVENVLMLPLSRRDGIGKLAACLKLRAQELSSGNDRSIKLAGMKAIKPYMKEMIISEAKFPIPGINPEAVLGVGPIVDNVPEPMPEHQSVEEDYVDMEPQDVDGTLRPPPENLRRGDTVLTIFLEKWGFKDAAPFQEPRVVISVRDANGEVLEAIQETPVAKRNTHSYVVFENTVYIQTPLNQLPDGAAIFFEFRHYKPKKNKKSVKCYCFMEMDEIKAGPLQLEIYKKPTIFKRNKKPSLLSIKQLYLHMELALDVI